MSGNYYSIDIWGLLIALVMVAVAAGISEAMRMGIGKILLWSACRALLQLCAMGFIMEFVIKSNNPWLVLLLGEVHADRGRANHPVSCQGCTKRLGRPRVFELGHHHAHYDFVGH